MGKAIIINDVSFALKNLGQVTPSQEIPIEGVSIIAPESFLGETCQLFVDYSPQDTQQRGVVWSIESGDEYASINSDGLLTILSDADESPVTIKVSSIYDDSITDEVTVVVSYVESPVADWYFPLTADANEASGLVTPDKVNVISYGADGAQFSSSSQTGISIPLNEAQPYFAVAFSMKATNPSSVEMHPLSVNGLERNNDIQTYDYGLESVTSPFVIYQTSGSSTTTAFLSASSNVMDGQFHKIAIAVLNNVVVCYVDGQKAAQGTVPVYYKTTYKRRLIIGTNWHYIMGDSIKSIDGYIKAVRVFFDGLTEKQMQLLTLD